MTDTLVGRTSIPCKGGIPPEARTEFDPTWETSSVSGQARRTGS